MSLTKNRFPEIIRGLTPMGRASKLEAALEAGAKLIEAGAKQRVARDTDDLHNAIHIEDDGPFQYRVVAGDGNVFWGHFVELGTTQHAPRPFLIPSVEANTAAVLGLVNGALKRL